MPATLLVNARLVNEGRELEGDLRFADGTPNGRRLEFDR